eukprot:g4656.t1
MLNSRIRMVVTTTFHVLALVLSGGLNDLKVKVVIVAGVNLGPRGLRSSSASANGANDNGVRNGRGAGTDHTTSARVTTTPGSATRTEKDRPAGPTTGPHWGPLEAAPSTTACTSTPFPVAYNDAGQVGQSWCAGGGHGRADEDGNAVGGKFDLARDKGFVGKQVLVLLLGRSAANTIELGSSENPVAKKFWDGSVTPSGLYREKGDVVVALERKGFNVWFVSGINPESGKHCPFRTWDSVDYTDTVDDTRKWMSRALVQRVRRFWKLFGGGIAVWMNRYPFISGANFFHWLVADEAEFDIESSAAAPTPDGAWGCNGENKKQALLEFYDNAFGKEAPPGSEEDDDLLGGFYPSKDITAQPESESRADPAKTGGIVEGHPITTCIASIKVGEMVSALVTQETPGAGKENRSRVHGGKVTPLMYGKDERPTKRRREADGKDADKAFALSGTWEDVDGVEALEGRHEEDRQHGSEDDACKNAGKRFRGRVFGDGGYTKLGCECAYCGDEISSGAERYVVNVAAWLDAGRWQ